MRDDAALRLCRAGEDSVQGIASFLKKRRIDAWYRADGELGLATSESQIGGWADAVMTADRLKLDYLTVLTSEEARARIDSPVVRGGVH